MAKTNTWVLVADAARARIFQLEGGGGLKASWNLQLIGSNEPSREIASDRPGRSFDSAGPGRHAMEPPTDPARHAQTSFAHDVVEQIDDERKQNAFDALVVVAPPQFLGDLRNAMPDPLRKLVSAEIDKDLSKLRPDEIIEHIAAAL